jgi:hypothetical protein
MTLRRADQGPADLYDRSPGKPAVISTITVSYMPSITRATGTPASRSAAPATRLGLMVLVMRVLAGRKAAASR